MLIQELSTLEQVDHILNINGEIYHISLVAVLVNERRCIYKLDRPIKLAYLRPARIEDLHYRKMLVKEVEYLALDVQYSGTEWHEDIYKFTVSSIEKDQVRYLNGIKLVDELIEEKAKDIEAVDLFKILEDVLSSYTKGLKELKVTFYTRRVYDYVFILSHTLNLKEGSYDYISILKRPDDIWTFTPLVNPTDPLGYREKDIYNIEAKSVEEAIINFGKKFKFEKVIADIKEEII